MISVQGVSLALWSLNKSVKSLLKLPSGCLHVLSGLSVSLAFWIVKESIIVFGFGQVGNSVNTPKLKIFVVVICDPELFHLL